MIGIGISIYCINSYITIGELVMSKVLAVNSMWKLRTEYIEFDSPTFSINRILTDEEIIVSKMELEALRDALNTIDL